MVVLCHLDEPKAVGTTSSGKELTLKSSPDLGELEPSSRLSFEEERLRLDEFEMIVNVLNGILGIEIMKKVVIFGAAVLLAWSLALISQAREIEIIHTNDAVFTTPRTEAFLALESSETRDFAVWTLDASRDLEVTKRLDRREFETNSVRISPQSFQQILDVLHRCEEYFLRDGDPLERILSESETAHVRTAYAGAEFLSSAKLNIRLNRLAGDESALFSQEISISGLDWMVSKFSDNESLHEVAQCLTDLEDQMIATFGAAQ